MGSNNLVFWNSIHLEVASNPFCLLVNSPWLLVFALCLFFMIFSGFNLYCWKGIHFSWSNCLIFLLIHIGLIYSLHYWFYFLYFFYFLLLKVSYLYPSFGHLFIHYLPHLLDLGLVKVSIFQIHVN